ncbi:methyltransferase, ATP-grasp peptide maturase system [Actinomadura meyerae]|uniref:Protein-L-isoaspartate O-methyltransferase n=1 Tax=Actinomadura meyerae TaxID=240840 RepID=A0A239I8P5_9ACTN|nr:ATP-grasp peptide maturase system methyltransferase [Actinomadura meyerae]SNS89772.1 methyltransferase, ATP-grasp peptide maturase system [Actinomadura meyerae]
MGEVMTPSAPDPARLRAELAARLAVDDPAWRKAVEVVPRHRFVPGFYADSGERSEDGLTVWEPVTETIDRARWLAAVYSDTTLITQFDGDETDWSRPLPRTGGTPTSSSTLPSLVVRMWADAELQDGHNVLEIGTGTGYSTALACERLGDNGDVTSVEVDNRRLNHAAAALYDCGYAPDLAVADGLYGYWPCAPYDRIVAACSVRTIPRAWLAQTRPGGKILTTLSGWLYGYARVLLTVQDDGTAEGPLLPGTISFMAARVQERPEPGNPAHWASLNPEAETRTVRHAPERLDEATEDGFSRRFLAQLAAPNAQIATLNGATHLIDVTTGSTAVFTPDGVRQTGPLRLWDAIEKTWDAWDQVDRPALDTFRLSIAGGAQRIYHPTTPALSFALPT